jgi:hypothetical protein
VWCGPGIARRGDQRFVETRLWDVVFGLCLCLSSAQRGMLTKYMIAVRRCLVACCAVSGCPAGSEGQMSWGAQETCSSMFACLCGAIHHKPHGLRYLRLLVLCVRPGASFCYTLKCCGMGCSATSLFAVTFYVTAYAWSLHTRAGLAQGTCSVLLSRPCGGCILLSVQFHALWPPCAIPSRGMATPCRLCSRVFAQQHTYSDAGFTSEAPAFEIHMGVLQVVQQEGTFGGITVLSLHSRLFCMTAATCSCRFAVL